MLNDIKENEIKNEIRVLRFMIGFIALVVMYIKFAVEYELEANNLLKLEISDS
ncbi:hypothetical protein QU601_000289 [Orientia tsutsugamushi]